MFSLFNAFGSGHYVMQPLLDVADDAGMGSSSEPVAGSESNQTIDTPNQEQTTTVQPVVPTDYEIEGIGKVTAQEIKEWKLGHMRQSDYTKKTQEVARQREEYKTALEVYNYLKANPQIVEAMARGEAVPNANIQNTPIAQVNPYNSQIKDLNMKLATIELDNTINQLKSKYPDFNEVEVLAEADKRGTTDLEFVYNGLKGSRNNEAEIRRRIEAELTEKIRKNGVATQTIIASNDIAATTNYGLTESEISMAENMGLTPEQYAKFKR